MRQMLGTVLVLFSTTCLGGDEGAPYVVMQDDLAVLKHDFNQAVDQLRLVFIVGPT